MTFDAFVAAHSSFLRRRPFKSFQVELVSGTRLLIAHPEALTIRGELLYFVSRAGESHLLQTESVCQIHDLLKNA